mmetsp:Transcript_6645/g.5752  ORF Transcript_6645/g.5752 Transcript_6645/m.5752 type:complete len:100 (+) Transcript_6645:682-981(+)
MESSGRIDIFTVTPGSITTQFTLNRTFIDTCMPGILVKNVLNSLGKADRIAGWWLHEIWEQAQTGIWYFNHQFYTVIMEFFGVHFGYNDFLLRLIQNRR